MDSSTKSYSSSEEEETLNKQEIEIREDLKSMTFEEIMKLKEELGAKIYNEAVLGIDNRSKIRTKRDSKCKRLNKNRPREQSAKRQVPFLSLETHTRRKKDNCTRDPRFDERSGEYNTKKFKENYQFLSEIREKEITLLKRELNRTADEKEKIELKKTMQRLINKNVEEQNWHKKQQLLLEEQKDIEKAIENGKQPFYMSKKQKKLKQLVAQFEELKQKGKLNKHLERRRKKNAAKDRKRISFD